MTKPLINDPCALGRCGERMAAEHLRRKGLRIVAANCRIGRSEIDLIADSRSLLVFAEVKTRRANPSDRSACGIGRQCCGKCAAGHWQENAAAAELQCPKNAQVRRLRAAAVGWLQRQQAPIGGRRLEIRFDLIRVLVGKRDELIAIEQLEGAL